MNPREYLEKNPVIDDRAFGRFVRQRREELGKTIRGFAEEIGIAPAYLVDIEKGNRYAPKNKLEALVKALEIPDAERMEYDDMAATTRGNLCEDVQPYLGAHMAARMALRKARDLGCSEEDWMEVIASLERKHNGRNN